MVSGGSSADREGLVHCTTMGADRGVYLCGIDGAVSEARGDGGPHSFAPSGCPGVILAQKVLVQGLRMVCECTYSSEVDGLHISVVMVRSCTCCSPVLQVLAAGHAMNNGCHHAVHLNHVSPRGRCSTTCAKHPPSSPSSPNMWSSAQQQTESASDCCRGAHHLGHSRQP